MRSAAAWRPDWLLLAVTLIAVIAAPPLGLLLMPDKFIALSAYLPALALIITWLRRRDGGAPWRVLLVVNALALLVGLAFLALGVALAGWGTLLFMGQG